MNSTEVPLIENRKWLGFRGIIGRRDYAINFLISFAGLFVFAGFLYFGIWISGAGFDALSSRRPAAAPPMSPHFFFGSLIVIFSLLGMVGVIVASFGNLHRRIKDIRGVEKDTWVFTATAYILTLIPYLQLIVSCLVMFMPGEMAKRTPSSNT